METVSDVITEDDDSSSFVGREVTLAGHLEDVRTTARTFARNLGFSVEVAEDVALAARLHDIGKADPRFQRMLLGGSEIRASMSQVFLAKSKGESRDAVARELARERADYPKGYRHELLSVAMLDGVELPAHDRELVLHLVGSHHGWCRPFAPATDPGPSLEVPLELDGFRFRADAAHTLARLDSGVPERFFGLIERYGWWGLAWLEAVMRLADHRASELYEREESGAAVSEGAIIR
jgi:CRISPR-associated endonuclease/helicase Cas3